MAHPLSQRRLAREAIIQINHANAVSSRRSVCSYGSPQHYTGYYRKYSTSSADQDNSRHKTRNSRETGELEPWRQRKGSNRSSHDRGGREEWTPQAWRNDHRADIREHWYRARDGSMCQGLQDDFHDA